MLMIALSVSSNTHLIKIINACSALIFQDLIILGVRLLKSQEVVFALRFAEMDWILGPMNVMMATTEMEMAAHLGAK
jgi:hypothetical protein